MAMMPNNDHFELEKRDGSATKDHMQFYVVSKLKTLYFVNWLHNKAWFEWSDLVIGKVINPMSNIENGMLY